MRLGLQLGYWGAQPPPNAPELVAAAEAEGFDAVFAAESWGSDAFTPLAWWGSSTERVRLGTSVVQISARTPTSCAMHALTLDHLSGGRHILGLGVSGPQVVEGWYGQPFAKPLARTREYVDVIRKVLAREEPVNGFFFVVAAGCTYLVAYRFYSAFISAKVLALDPTRATPAEQTAPRPIKPPATFWAQLKAPSGQSFLRRNPSISRGFGALFIG